MATSSSLSPKSLSLGLPTLQLLFLRFLFCRHLLHTSAMLAATLRNVGYYKDGRTLLQDANLDIPRNSCTAILGPSGSGKTTLLNVLLGLSTDDRSVSGDINIDSWSAAFVQARPSFAPGLTVMETLEFVAGLRKIEKVPPDLIESVGLKGREKVVVPRTFSKDFSLAEARSLAIALELLQEPEMLILDEPTSALDSRQGKRIIQTLMRLKSRCTIICTLHQPRSDVFFSFDHVVLLSKGTTIYQGPPGGIGVKLAAAVGEWSHKAATHNLRGHESVSDWALEIAAAGMISKKVENNADPALENAARLEAVGIAQITMADCHGGARGQTSMERNRKLRTLPKQQWWLQMLYILRREFITRMRDTTTLTLITLIFVIQGVLLMAVFLDMPQYVKGQQPIQIADLFLSRLPTSSNLTKLPSSFPWLDEGETNRTDQEPVLSSMLLNPAPVRFWDAPLGAVLFNLVDRLQEAWAPSQKFGYPVVPLPAVAETDLAAGILRAAELLQSTDAIWRHFAWANVTWCEGWTGTIVLSNGNYWLCYMVQAKPVIDTLVDSLRIGRLDDLMSVMATLLQKEEWLTNGADRPPPSRRLEGQLQQLERSEALEFLLGLDLDYSMSWLRSRGLDKFTGGAVEALLPILQEFVGGIYPTCMAGAEICSIVSEPSVIGTVDQTLQIVKDFFDAAGVVFDMAGILFFACLFLGLASHEIMLIFPKQRIIFNSDTVKGYYDPSAYFIGRQISDLPFQFAFVLVLVTPVYFGCGFSTINNGFLPYFYFLLISWLIISAGYGYGYMLATLCPTLRHALVVTPVVFIIWLSTAGFLLRDKDLPSWILPLRFLSFQRWGFFALCLNSFPRGSYVGALPNEINLALAGVTETRIGINIGMLVALNFLYRAVSFLGLKFLWRRVDI